jgi:GLPGLI family protein
MKNVLLLIIFTSSFSILAQTKNLNCGTVSYLYTLPAEQLVTKKSKLYFNDTISKFVYSKIEKDENIESQFNNEGNFATLNISVSDEQGVVVFRNFKSEIVLDREAKIGEIFEAYTYNDNWIKINWDIQKDTMRIGKFLCQKALGEFRGRTYTVWFSEEIPFPYGPWKLFGLPGLILEAEDSEHMFKVTFESINYPFSCAESDLEIPTANEKKTLKEYVEFEDNFTENMVNKLKSRLSRSSGVTLTPGPKSKNIRKYRVEKRYEWEK